MDDVATIPKIFSYLCQDHAKLQYLKSNQLYHIYRYKGQIILISKPLTQLIQIDKQFTSQKYLALIDQASATFRHYFLSIKQKKILAQKMRGRTQLLLEGYNVNFLKMLEIDRQNTFLAKEDYLMRWWKKFKQMAESNILCYQLSEQNLVVNKQGEFVFFGFANLNKSQQGLIKSVKKQNYQFFRKYFIMAKNNQIKQEIQSYLTKI